MENGPSTHMPDEDAARLQAVATLLAQAAETLAERAAGERDAGRRYLLQDAALAALLAAGQATVLLDQHPGNETGLATQAGARTGDSIRNPMKADAEQLLQEADLLLVQIRGPLPELPGLSGLPGLPELRQAVADLAQPGILP